MSDRGLQVADRLLHKGDFVVIDIDVATGQSIGWVYFNGFFILGQSLQLYFQRTLFIAHLC